ncbi:glutamine--fructose-6-phosphate transaminase (isomerizing) [Streptomyces griseus]
MCGIVGYVGGQSAQDVVVAGLKRLEYRGYDSAGVAVLADGGLAAAKKAGKLVNLEKELGDRPLPAGRTGIGHTRWATHGAPTDVNAHPHLDNAGRVAVVHNGIIENFAALRRELTGRGHALESETDTEVVAHLLAEAFSAGGDLADAMRQVCRRLEGAFTLVAVHADQPDVVVGARRNSPLVVGVGQDEWFLASDVAAFIAHTRSAIELGQDQVVELSREGVTVTGFDGALAEVREYHVDWDASAAEKGGYASFMLKEIADQPQAVADTLLGRIDGEGALHLDEVRIPDTELREVDKVVIVACGTAFHAGMIAKYAIEHWTRLPCETELASEFRYRDPILDQRTLVVAISQSGETMDTLMALRHAREQGAKVLAICNTNGSTIPRESDAVLYTHAGPEVAVASTKAFLTQLVACYLRGVVGVVAGSERYPGAAVLAVAGALRGGAGAVRYVGPGADAVIARFPEALVHAGPPSKAGRVQAWVVGPGLGDGRGAAAAVADVLAADVPVLVDADGLRLLDAETVRTRTAPTVLTPHAGEAAALLGTAREEVESGRLTAVRELAARYRATVLLKGSTTLIAEARDTPVRVNPTGTAWLATAGSGDVLSGLTGSLLAAGLAPRDAASVAAHLHGLAARHGSDGAPVSAQDVADRIPAAWRDVRAG